MEYKHGRDNKVADAFSRKFEEGTTEKNGELQAISFSVATWINDLRVANSIDNQIQDLLSQLEAGKLNPLKYIVSKGLLFYKGWIYMGDNPTLKEQIFQMHHDSPVGGYAGYEKSYQRAKMSFY